MNTKNVMLSVAALTASLFSAANYAGDAQHFLSFGKAMINGGNGTNITYSHLGKYAGWTASTRFLSANYTGRHYASGQLSYAQPIGSQLVLTAGSGIGLLRTHTNDDLPTDGAIGSIIGREIRGANYYLNMVAELGMAVRYEDVMYSFTFDAVPQVGTFNLGFAF